MSTATPVTPAARCEAGVTAAHQRDAQSRGRSGFPVAGLLLSPSGQQISVPEKPHDFCSAEMRPMGTLDLLEWWRRCIAATGSFFPSFGIPGQNGLGICCYLLASHPGGWCRGRVIRESPLLFFLARALALHPSFGSKL